MNTPVNPEIAKLLKEKKFNEPCLSYWKDLNLEGHRFKDWNNETIGDSPMHKRNAGYYSAPTISEVVMWLYKEHGIWVEVNFLPNVDKFAFISKPLNFKKPKEFSSYKEYYNATSKFISKEKYNSPTKAYEASIEYALKELI
jgi:hypothetical protein